MVYVGVAIGLLVLGLILRYTVFSPIPRTIASLMDAERLVNYHIAAANRRLRREAWMLTFVVSLVLHVTVKLPTIRRPSWLMPAPTWIDIPVRSMPSPAK